MAGRTSEQTYAMCFLHRKYTDAHVPCITFQIQYRCRKNSFKLKETKISFNLTVFHFLHERISCIDLKAFLKAYQTKSQPFSEVEPTFVCDPGDTEGVAVGQPKVW